MSGDPPTPGLQEERIEGVPLYLIPKVIADHIREKRETVFRISVGRVREHRYRIVVETFNEHAQQATQAVAVPQGPPVQPVQQVVPVRQRKGGRHGS
ncbi:MAG: hypothetical protein A4E35_01284 [Methanoregula sp. PtaU1.Bin051]|nr:MAG: hypothetical protein A4E35_01284 [Methanoregula sp. PtaU1.Bin051]